MPKRRRERDRPASRPDGLYDPNKRVLLSYDSADEDVQDDVGTLPADTQLPELTFSAINGQLGTTAEQAEASTSTNTEIDRKDHRNRKAYRPQDNEPVQRTFFGSVGLSSGNADWDQSYQDESADALAYLKAVRSQREDIPDTLVAPWRPPEDTVQHEEYYDQSQYEDDDWPDDSEVTYLAQELYTQRLLSRFDKLRDMLESMGASTGQHDVSLDDKEVLKKYKLSMKHQNPPQLAQLHEMTPQTARHLLEHTRQVILSTEESISSASSAWIFGLLARQEDYDRMHMEKVGQLRDFAKEAAHVKKSFELKERDHHAPEYATEVDDEQKEARANTIATLDMILAVVGLRFGQKDLLEQRVWMGGG